QASESSVQDGSRRPVRYRQPLAQACVSAQCVIRCTNKLIIDIAQPISSADNSLPFAWKHSFKNAALEIWCPRKTYDRSKVILISLKEVVTTIVCSNEIICSVWIQYCGSNIAAVLNRLEH